MFLAVFLIYLLRITGVYSSSSPFRSEYYVLIVYGFPFLYLLTPLPIFNYRGRLYALKLMLKCLLAPILGVAFPVVWMTDQWVSLTTPLRDTAYTICYFTSLDFDKVKVNPCTSASAF